MLALWALSLSQLNERVRRSCYLNFHWTFSRWFTESADVFSLIITVLVCSTIHLASVVFHLDLVKMNMKYSNNTRISRQGPIQKHTLIINENFSPFNFVANERDRFHISCISHSTAYRRPFTLLYTQLCSNTWVRGYLIGARYIYLHCLYFWSFQKIKIAKHNLQFSLAKMPTITNNKSSSSCKFKLLFWSECKEEIGEDREVNCGNWKLREILSQVMFKHSISFRSRRFNFNMRNLFEC